MKTLHLCHWRDKAAFKADVKNLGASDALVVYGNPSPLEMMHIQSHMQAMEQPWHLFTEHPETQREAKQHLISTIDASQWLQLIIEHDNTWAWK
jgi:hypothetical protein